MNGSRRCRRIDFCSRGMCAAISGRRKWIKWLRQFCCRVIWMVRAMKSLKFKLTIAYDGTSYQGWQTQKIGLGVQQKVEQALAKLLRSKPLLHSSSRTDTGVHAIGMIAHFEVPASECKMPPRKLALAL